MLSLLLCNCCSDLVEMVAVEGLVVLDLVLLEGVVIFESLVMSAA